MKVKFKIPFWLSILLNIIVWLAFLVLGYFYLRIARIS